MRSGIDAVRIAPLLAGVAVCVVAAPPAGAEIVTPPVIIEQREGSCPSGARIDGDRAVKVKITVETDGSVGASEVELEGDRTLAEEALRVVRSWKFAPAMRADGPVRSRIRVNVVLRCGVVEFGAVDRSAPKDPPDEPLRRAPAPPPPPASAPTSVLVVGQRRAPRSASDATLKRDVMSSTPHRTANDLLLAVPGVFITQHSGEGKAYQIFLRGFDAVHGQDLEVWAGGAPVNDVSNIHGQGYADLHFLMPELIQEVQALPGSYDPRQGDFAVAGTIRMKLGYSEPGMTVRGGLGSFGARRAFLAYRPSAQPDGTFAAFEAYKTNGFGPNRSADRVSSVAQWTRNLSDQGVARILVSSYAGRFDSAGVVRLDDLQSHGMDRFDTYDPRQGGHSGRTQVVLELSDRADRSSWALTPYVVRRSMLLRSDFTGFLVDPANGDLSQQSNEATTLGATGRYRQPVRLSSEQDAIEAGFSARSDWIEQSQRRLSGADESVSANLVDASVRASDLAGYLDASLSPIRRVSVRGGVRVDGLSYMVEDRIAGNGSARSSQGLVASKRATLAVGLARGVVAVASYGEGFRSPQARSLSSGQTMPFTLVSSCELGVRWSEGEKWQSSAAVYRSRLSDDLVFDHATGRNELVPSTVRTGAAVDLVARPADWFLSTASLTYTRAAYDASDAAHEKGALLAYVPQVVARASLALTPRLGRVAGREVRGHLGASSTLLARRPLPYAQMGSDVLLLDASARVRAGEVELGADACNLLDRPWYDGEFVYASSFRRDGGGSLVPARHVSAGAPRTMMLTLTLYL